MLSQFVTGAYDQHNYFQHSNYSAQIANCLYFGPADDKSVLKRREQEEIKGQNGGQQSTPSRTPPRTKPSEPQTSRNAASLLQCNGDGE